MLNFSSTKPSNIQFQLNVTDGTPLQTWDGVGAAMTASTAYVLSAVNSNNSSNYSTLLNDLFSPSNGIGLNLLRIPLGASDFDPPNVGANNGEYNFQPTQSSTFALQTQDTSYLIPQTMAAQGINPAVQSVLSPWSPPGWMKSSGSKGSDALQMYGNNTYSTINSTNGPEIASYLAQSVTSYEGQYVAVYALTPQNEPLNPTANYPAQGLQQGDEANLVNYLFQQSAFTNSGAQLWGFDHNTANYTYAEYIANNTAANGSAFHCYSQDGKGDDINPANLGATTSNTKKPVWMTECTRISSTGGASNLKQDEEQSVLNAVANGARGVIYWNAVLQNDGPVLNSNVCTSCLGVVNLDSNFTISYSPEAYALGHIGRFVIPGAQVVTANQQGTGGVIDAAFRNPDGSIVVVAYNDYSGGNNAVTIAWNNQYATYSIAPGALVTFKWQGTSNIGPVLANTNYQIANVSSSKCIDATSSGVANHTVIQQYTCGSNQQNQGWQFVATTGGKYRLVNRNSMSHAQVIDAVNKGTSAGTKLQTYLWSQGANQQWIIGKKRQ